MRLYYPNYLDYATTTIAAATENADLPASNLAHPHRDKHYRTGVTQAAETITIDLGSALAVRTLILLDHDLTAGDSSLYLYGNATDSWGAPSFSQELTFNANVLKAYLSAAQTYRYWRIAFTKSAADQTRDIGRVYLGPSVELALAPALPDGLEVVPVDLSQTGRAAGGQTYSEIKAIYDEIRIDFPPVAGTQWDQLLALARAVGTHTPFFVDIDPTLEPYDLLYYVKAKSLKGGKVKMWGSSPLWDASLDLTEEPKTA